MAFWNTCQIFFTLRDLFQMPIFLIIVLPIWNQREFGWHLSGNSGEDFQGVESHTRAIFQKIKKRGWDFGVGEILAKMKKKMDGGFGGPSLEKWSQNSAESEGGVGQKFRYRLRRGGWTAGGVLVRVIPDPPPPQNWYKMEHCKIVVFK